ncbi:hypothetical protein VTK73DRAFT_7575 [Phialemonium thermophilum]|uniref:Oxidase ustYa n=1 Tax=Phialemonium thermophilum TaxID=223376 RepID=A0ABR3WDT4_9PEZI
MDNRPKREHDDEQEAFLEQATVHDDEARPLPHESSRRTVAWYARWVIEALMAITIVALVVHRLPDGRETRRSPVPALPRKMYTFVEDQGYVNEDMFFNTTTTLRTLHKWIDLSSDSRGYVQIKNPKSYDLPDPYIVAINRTSDGPAYMVSLYHQLHCLSYVIEHFQTGFAGVELTKEVAHHSAHCFDYLRQSIMCAADTTLEGDSGFGPGWGSRHECTDYEALLEWANENSALKWKKNMPDESTL